MKLIWAGRSEALPMEPDDITVLHRHYDDYHQRGDPCYHGYEDQWSSERLPCLLMYGCFSVHVIRNWPAQAKANIEC